MADGTDVPTPEPDEIGALLRAELPRRAAPARLRGAVLEALHPLEPRRRPALWLAPAFAAVATALLMVLWLAPALPRPGPDALGLFSRAVVSEHVRAALWGEVNPDAAQAALPRAMQESGVVLNWVFTGDDDLRLVSARPTYLDGARAMTLVYRDRGGRTVSYVIAAGPDVAIPERGRVQIERWRPLLRQDDGMSLIVWKQSGLVCVMVSDLVSEDDLGRFKQYFAKVRASTELSRGY